MSWAATIDSYQEKAEPRVVPSLWRLAGVALTLACLDLAGLVLNNHSWSTGGVTIVWASNGLLLGVLLCVPRRQWAAYFSVGFAVDLAINIVLSYPFWPSAYIATCNMIEVGIAAFLLYPIISPRPDLTQRKQLIALLAYGVVLAPTVASLLAQLNTVSGTLSAGLVTSFKQWFTADALGIAIVTPLYLSFSQRRQVFSGRAWYEVVGLFSLLGVSTVFVFYQTRFPFLFLLLPCLLLLGVRLRLAGSAMGLLILSIVGGFFTISGRGPIMLMRGGSVALHDLMLQFFIAVTMLVLYIIEVVTAERERLQVNLMASETRFRLLAEASNDVIVLSGLTGERRYVSPAAKEILGWEPDDLLGGTYRNLVHPEDVAIITNLMHQCRAGGLPAPMPYRCRKRDGTYLWMEANIRLYYDSASGKPIGFVNVVRDISNRKAAEEELNKAFRLVETQAKIDGLTGIANRRQFDEAIDREWRRAIRDRSPLSLLLIDVDHFKPYNDIYGHLCGDTCLRNIAVTAQKIIHRSADLLARYGGEEFVVILPNTESSGAQRIAEQIRTAVELQQIPHSGNPHTIITVSIGCATQVPEHDTDSMSLIKAADSALYRAKSAGRNVVELARTSAA